MNLNELRAFFSAALKNTSVVPLLKNEPDKPLDSGNGLLAVSLGRRGEIISLSTYHPTEGYVVIHREPQFPVDKYFDVNFVRAYRNRLATLDTAASFGLTPLTMLNTKDKNGSFAYQYGWINGVIPITTAQAGPINVKICTFPGLPGEKRLYQIMLFSNPSDTKIDLSLMRGGVISVNRSAYGQLTEGGPLPPPPVLNLFSLTPWQLKVYNPNLDLGVSWRIYSEEGLVTQKLPPQIKDGGHLPLAVEQRWTLSLPPRSEQLILNFFSIINRQEFAEEEKSLAVIERAEINQAWQHSLDKPGVLLAKDMVANLKSTSLTTSLQKKKLPLSYYVDYIINRNINYILSCCAIPVEDQGDKGICLVTDHQILPLSWNRDAYYQIALLRNFLLRYKNQLSKVTYTELKKVIRSHLLWTFNIAQRVDGFWGRSYTANGKVKDKSFQLDQQCYPLLELIDYLNVFTEDKLFIELKEKVILTIERILSLKDQGSWLLKTTETPADDRVELPYHFSSQVLWWKLCRDLDYLNQSYSFSTRDFGQIADEIQKEIKEKMVIKDRGIFCYVTDLKSGYRLYHDANDLPTVYAPEWGFCLPTDPIWLKTMDFAFSPANELGYFPGPFGGLGSIHTPHPWPLGTVQFLVFARLTKNQRLYEETLHSLIALAQSDGIFSEAVSADNRRVVSRHWFSWPGALLSSELLRGTNHWRQSANAPIYWTKLHLEKTRGSS